MKRFIVTQVQRFFVSTIFLLIIFISGLAHILTKDSGIPSTVNKEFTPYVKDFIKSSKDNKTKISLFKNNKSLIIKFGDTKSIEPKKELIGYCDTEDFKILIDKEYWLANPKKHQIIIDHELGHCLLGRIHRNTFQTNNQPKSIMFPETIDEKFYYENQTSLRKELFNKKYFNTIAILNSSIKNNPIYYNNIEEVWEQVRLRENEINKDIVYQAHQVIDFNNEPLEIRGELKR